MSATGSLERFLASKINSRTAVMQATGDQSPPVLDEIRGI
jgi:hypothetical protein